MNESDFYGNNTPAELLRRFGSPLYVYSEYILRRQCRAMKGLVKYHKYGVNYTPKANGNLALLQIINNEGLDAEAMSPAEIHINLAAGFTAERILYISNNVSEDEMLYAMERGILTSIDSLSQLERYGRLHQRTGLGKRVAVRINPGVGAGHHAKVVTGGDETKFGVNLSLIPEMKGILDKYGLTLAGLNHHIGSGFTDTGLYLAAAETACETALQFDSLEFIDLGGGFYINYHKQNGGKPFDYSDLGVRLDGLINDFTAKYRRELVFKTELGRYIAAEAGVLLGTVHSVKYNGANKFIGTDIGMNVLVRPSMYDSYHDIAVYREGGQCSPVKSPAAVVGNICESGDILAKDRCLPDDIREGDILCVMDAGAYGYSMCSNYNARLRPAEVLIRENGEAALIRRRDTADDLTRGFIPLERVNNG
jgi:diaminopimelate decarboxylase